MTDFTIVQSSGLLESMLNRIEAIFQLFCLHFVPHRYNLPRLLHRPQVQCFVATRFEHDLIGNFTTCCLPLTIRCFVGDLSLYDVFRAIFLCQSLGIEHDGLLRCSTFLLINCWALQTISLLSLFGRDGAVLRLNFEIFLGAGCLHLSFNRGIFMCNGSILDDVLTWLLLHLHPGLNKFIFGSCHEGRWLTWV